MTRERWATFDCYGTLIDWNGGIRRELARLFGPEAAGLLLGRYHRIEPELQRENPGWSYREVLSEVLRRLGAAEPDSDALALALPSWQPFPDVRPALEELRRRGWRLGMLSNTDREFLDASIAAIGVPFDEAFVAGEIGSYKPAPGHWRSFEQRHGRLPDIHVAASLFHDVEPAGELGLRSVWINREREPDSLLPARTLPDLERLPETLDELAPA